LSRKQIEGQSKPKKTEGNGTVFKKIISEEVSSDREATAELKMPS